MQSIYNFATKLFHCTFPQITYVNYDIPMYSLHCSTSLFFFSLYISIDHIGKLFYFHVFIPLITESFLFLVSLYFSTDHIINCFISMSSFHCSTSCCPISAIPGHPSIPLFCFCFACFFFHTIAVRITKLAIDEKSNLQTLPHNQSIPKVGKQDYLSWYFLFLCCVYSIFSLNFESIQ
jgi:hypothetical protein